MNGVKHALPHKALKTINYTLFHIYLLYCPKILASSTQANLYKTIYLQKKAKGTRLSNPWDDLNVFNNWIQL